MFLWGTSPHGLGNTWEYKCLIIYTQNLINSKLQLFIKIFMYFWKVTSHHIFTTPEGGALVKGTNEPLSDQHFELFEEESQYWHWVTLSLWRSVMMLLCVLVILIQLKGEEFRSALINKKTFTEFNPKKLVTVDTFHI